MKFFLTIATVFVIAQQATSIDWLSFNGRYWGVVTTGGYNFNDAQNVCKAYGGNLASVHSALEGQFVNALVDIYYGERNGASVWLGAYLKPNGTWAWVDGSPWHYTFWAPGEPNPLPDHQCGYLSNRVQGVPYMVANPCSSGFWPVCKK